MLLVDLTPASGAHGVRGIGTYVRGLASALEAADEEWRARISILVGPRQKAPAGYAASNAMPYRDWRAQDVGWLTAWLNDYGALKRAGVDVLHQTDPRRPFLPWST